MKTKAAVLWRLNQKWEVEEVGFDGPKRGQALVRMAASYDDMFSGVNLRGVIRY